MQKIGNEEIGYISALMQATGVMARDCVLLPGKVIFIVEPGDKGKAIGKKGIKIQALKNRLNKDVDIIEWSPNLSDFVANIFYQAKIREVGEREKDGKKVVLVSVEPRDKGLAIGRGGERINIARALIDRYYRAEIRVV